MLKWSKANAKIQNLTQVDSIKPYLNNRKVYSLDLLSGWSCPFANNCLSKVTIKNGKRSIQDGKNTEFRCFSATQEVMYTNVYNLRKHNFDTIRSAKTYSEIIKLMQESIPKNAGVIRFHVGGDFFNAMYFYAAMNFASIHPDKLFYAYTKSLNYWIKYRSIVNKIPNFVLTASYGGRLDHLIEKENLRSSKVVFSEQEAYDLGLEIDHNDSSAANPETRNESFALLIHGSQPAGSEASKALQFLKKNNIKHSYSRKK